MDDKKQLIEKLEKEAEKLHKSTRTDISFLSPLHNYIRSKSKIYYNWSMISTNTAVHIGAILAFIFSLFAYIIFQSVYLFVFDK